MQNPPEPSADQPTGQPEKNRPLNTTTEKTTSLVQYSGIAFQMLGTIGLGVWIGLKLDQWQDNHRPIWTIVLSLTAIGASLYLFIRQLTNSGR